MHLDRDRGTGGGDRLGPGVGGAFDVVNHGRAEVAERLVGMAERAVCA